MNWIEKFFRLTKREYFADFFITPPLTFVLGGISLYYDHNIFWMLWFAVGWMIWTLYEYAIHRWILHKIPVWKEFHNLHHANQKDYIATPPWATLLGYCFFLVFFGVHSSALAIGFSTGYIGYSILHTAFHYKRFSYESIFYKLNLRHIIHHKFDDVNFGVSVNWWDRLFRTEL